MKNLYDIICGLLDKNQLSGIGNRITKIDLNYNVEDIKITNNFFYINFNKDKITEDKLVDVLEDLLVFYCIPRTEIAKKLELYKKTNQLRHILDLREKAKSLFIKSHNRFGAQLGEPGELILYTIMEYFLDSPQIVSKMFYKQNTDMPVFGADGLHIGFDKETKNLIVYFCESKMYGELSDSLTKIKESLEKFLELKNGTTQRERDLQIINDLIEINDDEEKDYILSYLDPYSENSNNIQEIYSCMTIFDSDIYSKMTGKTTDEIKILFKKEYEKIALRAVNNFVQKIKDSEINALDFNFIVLPVDSVDNIREKFFAKLGLKVKYDKQAK